MIPSLNARKDDPVDRVNMFFHTHKKKNQTPLDEVFGIAMDLTNQVAEGIASYTPDEIFTQMMGLERHGRIWTCGAGPIPTTYFGRQPNRVHHLQEQLDQANAKIEEANTKIKESNTKIKESNRKMVAHDKKMTDIKEQLRLIKLKGQASGNVQGSEGSENTQGNENENKNVQGLD